MVLTALLPPMAGAHGKVANQELDFFVATTFKLVAFVVAILLTHQVQLT